jgi:hypothetical protein
MRIPIAILMGSCWRRRSPRKLDHEAEISEFLFLVRLVQTMQSLTSLV